MTVCEALERLEHYRGKWVVLVGVAGRTFEGTFLSQHCEADGCIAINRQRWVSMFALRRIEKGMESLESAKFPLGEQALWRKVEQIRGYPRRSDDKGKWDGWGDWVALYGRIGAPRPLRQAPRMAGYSGNGYGAGGTVPAFIEIKRWKTLLRGRSLVSVRTERRPPQLEEPPILPYQAADPAFPKELSHRHLISKPPY